MSLVSLDEARDHLRIDTTDGDSDLQLKVDAASESVLSYLKLQTEPDPVPAVVKAATLQLLGEMYKNREAEQDGAVPTQFGYGYLPRPVIALLYPLRDPSLA